MKARTITTTLILFTAAAFAAEPAAPPANSSAASTAVSSKGGGKATITIDVNGKKETREIEIGDGVEIKPGTPPKLDLPASSITYAKTVVRTTWLGVAAEEVSEELRAQLPLEPGSGLIVRAVMPESPAAAIGLQKNDVLMKLDDQLLTNPLQLRTLVSSRKEGDILRLTCFRRGQQSVMEVKLGTHEEGGEKYRIGSALAEWQHNYEQKPLTLDAKAVVLDKDGNVVRGQPDLYVAFREVEKFLHDSGADQKVIDETKRVLSDTTKAIREALEQAGAAKQEIQKGASEIVKALEQARAAMEKARKLADEEAAKKGK